MKISIDTKTNLLIWDLDGQRTEIALYSKPAFEALSQLWLKVGWNEKYVYTFSWMGRPIIQIPEDIIRTQEVIQRLMPSLIVETGVAHGGSLVFYASLCKLMGRGRVIGVDREIRPHNRKAIEEHPLASYITLIEGNSIEPVIVQTVRSLIKAGESTLIFLDSDHSKKHVLAELEAYHELVTRGSYIVATDGIMKDLYDVPRGKPEWKWDNPLAAVSEFLTIHSEFIIEQPTWPFNESHLNQNITHWPNAWLRRIR